MNFRFMEVGFHLGCMGIIIASITTFMSDFHDNKSTSLVDFKRFHETEIDNYPDFSLCIGGIWNTEKLKETYGIEDVERYAKFLRGEVWDENLLQIDYDEVTVNMTELVNGMSLWMDIFLKPPAYTWNRNSLIMESHISQLQTPDAKCLSLTLSPKTIEKLNRPIDRVEISFQSRNSSLYPLYALHYPEQGIMGNFYLDNDFDKASFGFDSLGRKTFLINMIEIIRRRNTHEEPCQESSDKNDQYVIKKLMESVKCKPPYMKNEVEFRHLEVCNNSNDMKQTHLNINSLYKKKWIDFGLKKPCDQVQTISFNTKDYYRQKNEPKEAPWILELAFMNEVYKEIRHSQAYGSKSCWSDVSAIIGFVCGVSIWQLPDGLKAFIAWIKQNSLFK